MILRKLIRPVSLLALVCLGLTGVFDLTPAHAASNSVVISEFRVRGPQGANDEFIELYNLSSSPVNIGGWKVNGSNNTGFTSVRVTITTGTTIQSGCHYLLTNRSSGGYSGSVPADQTYTTGITDTGGVALLDSGDAVIDAVGLDSGSAYKEGSPLASLGTSNADKSYERRPGGALGSGTDTDNNSADFQPRTTSDPQNSTSPCIGQSTGLSAVGAANPATLDIGSTTLLTVSVTPDTATGVGVSVDLSSIGGAANAAFYDDGTHGDTAAGDDIFSLSYTIPSNSGTGAQTLPVSVSDSQGHSASATISVSVNPPQLTIMDIQGSGDRSPHEGQTVRTTGVVTAVKSNGFWIQDPVGDGDDATSDGLFVFRGLPKPAVGDKVMVSGAVQEFATAGDPSAAPATELAGNPAVSVISSGNPLPAPVTISFVDPDGPIDQLEHLEGMRVHVDTLSVVGPTGGFLSEKDATSTSDGTFIGVIPGEPDPFREEGIELPAIPPAGAPCCIPTWNGGPQRIRVDTRSQSTLAALDVTSGAVVADLTGPLDFGDHAYTIVTDTAPTVVRGNITANPVPTPDSMKEFTVGAFNMERFYDTVDDPDKSDVKLTDDAFKGRLNKASLAIRNVMNSPDVLAVEEMENIGTLTELANKVNADSLVKTGVDPQYVPYLEEGNDIGGIDVGFLVKSSRITVMSKPAQEMNGKDALYTQPNGTQAILNDRPPLVLHASVTNEHETTNFIVIVNHLKALTGVDDPVDGRVRAKRAAQAEFLANLIQSYQAADPKVKIITVGDYNAFEVNDGYVDVMGTIAGNPTPAKQVMVASPDLVDPNLTDLETTLSKEQQYSYNFGGVAQTLDHVLVSQGMMADVSRFAYARNDADFPEVYRSDFTRPERLSDHDMPVAYFNLPVDHTAPVLTLPADFTVEATSPAGAVVTFTATALDANDGPTDVLCNPASGSTFALGTNTVSCTSKDARKNTATGEFHVNVVDTTAPVVIVTGVNDGANYPLGSVPVAGCSTSDTVSAIAIEATLAITGGTANHVGTFTATCSGATDAAGNTAAPVSATYKVTYAWSGFLPPVANGSIHQAGSTIPLKWTLAGAGNLSSVLSLTAVANPDCSGPAEGVPFAISTPGNSPFTFTNGMFQINWQTKGVAGGCYSIMLGLDDGTSKSVMVQLKSK